MDAQQPPEEERKTRLVTLTDRPPVRIVEDDWPVIAKARRDDTGTSTVGEPDRRWHLTVRRHSDGRTLVYGTYDSKWRNDPRKAGGEVLPAPYDGFKVAEAIKRVARSVEADEIADACVGSLPEETL